METYEERYVAFIDVLGFKELIERSETDEAVLQRLVHVLNDVTRMAELQKPLREQKEQPEYWAGMFRISTFSDSVLISTHRDSLGLMLITLVVGLMSVKLLGKGVLTRGAISHGKLIHTEKVVLGRGLIKAYQLESTTAIYPRILVDDSIVNDPSIKDSMKARFREDFDGLWHLNIFEDPLLMLGLFSEVHPKGGKGNDYLREARDEIEYSIKNAKSLSVKAKVTWLAKYYNEHAQALRLPMIPLQ